MLEHAAAARARAGRARAGARARARRGGAAPRPTFRRSTTRRWTATRCAPPTAAPGARLRIVGESRAGAPAAVAVGPGEACAISTGAAIPAGADAVIRVEDTRREGERGRADRSRSRPTATSATPATTCAPARSCWSPASRLGPAELGVLASVGRAPLLAGPRPRVALVTTGDELVGVDEPLPPGGVRNSGRYVIPALVERGRRRDGVAWPHARDDPRADPRGDRRGARGRRRRRRSPAACRSACTTTSGAALEALGVERHFAGVALRPGKPTLVRHARGDARVRPAGQPRLVAVSLPAVRAPGAARARRREPRARAHASRCSSATSSGPRGACTRSAAGSSCTRTAGTPSTPARRARTS